MIEDRLNEVAALTGLSVEQVRVAVAEVATDQRQWLETASVREIAVWIVANLERLTRLDPTGSPPQAPEASPVARHVASAPVASASYVPTAQFVRDASLLPV